jgi:hypothetical protein
MVQTGEDGAWFVGQRVRANDVDGIVAPGTCGTIRRIYRDTNTLIVLFDGAPNVCLVGGEEVESSDTSVGRECAVGSEYL